MFSHNSLRLRAVNQGRCGISPAGASLGLRAIFVLRASNLQLIPTTWAATTASTSGIQHGTVNSEQRYAFPPRC